MCNWLPDLIDLTDNEDQDVAMLSATFAVTFKSSQIFYQSIPVWFRKSQKDNPPYEDGFWHLVSYESDHNRKRYFDTLRAPKMNWAKAVIDNENDSAVTSWRYEESDGAIRVYLWLREYAYVVILEERLDKKVPHYMSITAFHVDDSFERSLQKKYKNRIK
ncbi:MAG: hypothetical protein ACXWQQ_05175 [Pseudobdellovibrio sp.]